MISIFAHGFGGTNGLPLPRWLLAYSVGFAVVIAFVTLRAVLPKPPARVERPRRSPPDALLIVTRSIGLLLFAGLVFTAAVGRDQSAVNIAPVTLIVLFWLGMQVVSVVAGDVFRLFNPFITIATLTNREERESPDPHWAAAGFLFAFVWFVFAYPEFYPPTPHEVAWFLGIYTIAVMVGASVWGRAWVTEGEGFSALFGLLARRSGRSPSNGTVALLCVYLGSILFDAISQTNWWIDVLGTSRGWHERALNTVGIVWTIAMVAIIYVGAARLAARWLDQPPDEVALAFAPAIVPLGFAWSVTHYISAFLVDVQNFIALLSDPLGRGWDLFHTIDNIVNYRLLTPTETGWVQVGVLLGGCVLSAFIVHRTALTTYRGHRAVRAMYPFVAVLVAGAVGAVGLLLGT